LQRHDRTYGIHTKYVMSIDQTDIYYCVACDTEAHAKPVEYVTPEVVLGELYGE